MPDGEVDNGGVLLDEERVLCEALDADDDVVAQMDELVPLHEALLVRLDLLHVTRTVSGRRAK
jgi:hypothetical protein